MDVTSTTVVVADTSVLINFIHVRRLDLFGALKGFRFVVAEQVVEEVTRPEQAEELDSALRRGNVHRETSTDPVEIGLYADLRRILGRGEAASLAMAEVRGWLIACDERGRFLREARQRLGDERLTNTPGLILLAIRGGHVSVQQADEMKRLLETRRFRMAFKSFADVL